MTLPSGRTAGEVAAAPYPIYGPERVARFLLGVLRTVPPGFFARLTQVNGGPGVVGYVDGRPTGVVALDVADGRLRGIRIVVDPEKLAGHTHVLSRLVSRVSEERKPKMARIDKGLDREAGPSGVSPTGSLGALSARSLSRLQ